MPTRALGALLAAIAAAAFVVSIVSGAWRDGHPRVDGRVFTAKDVHIGLLGGTGCNTGGTGECQPLPLGTTFTTVAYGELGGLALTTAPQLRPLYDMRAAPPQGFAATPPGTQSQPPFAAPPAPPSFGSAHAPASQPFAAQPAPPSFGSAHAPASQPPFAAPPAPPSQPPFAAPPAPTSQPPLGAPRPRSPTPAPIGAPRS